MKKATIGIILAVTAGTLLLFSLSARKEHAPDTPSQISPLENRERETDKEKTMQEIKITSSAFQHNGLIPAEYTCDGDDISPPLEIRGIPESTKTLALIMHDPDAPRAGGWTHWIKYNIKMQNGKSKMIIGEGEEPEGVSGRGTGGNTAYMGPCPPSGTHRYFFNVYALDVELNLKEGATKAEVEKAMEGHVVGKEELVGLYSRNG